MTGVLVASIVISVASLMTSYFQWRRIREAQKILRHGGTWAP